MDSFITFLLSAIEWIALLTFPIVLLGYYYRKFFKRIVFIAIFMSMFSTILHTVTNLPIVLIIFAQITLIMLLIKMILKFNLLETLTITSIGYGYYIFFQIILIELVVQLSTVEHLQFYHIANLKYSTQTITFILVFIFCYFINKYELQLNELRFHLKTPLRNNRYKTLLIVNALLLFIFLLLNFYFMMLEDFEHKFGFLLIIFIVLFICLFNYFILHIKFQDLRMIESKKFQFDQEQQLTSLLENLQTEFEAHFNVIVKLAKKNSFTAIKDYIEHQQLAFKQKGEIFNTTTFTHLANQDEILYTFLVNKQKLAGLFNIKIAVSLDSHIKKTLSLHHIRYLNTIIDDLIHILYKSVTIKKKVIHFQIKSDNEKFVLQISSDLSLDEESIANLKIIDALIQFKNLDATIVTSEFKPLNITIKCPFS